MIAPRLHRRSPHLAVAVLVVVAVLATVAVLAVAIALARRHQPPRPPGPPRVRPHLLRRPRSAAH